MITSKNATSQTPLSVVFITEAALPTKMVIPTARSSLQTSQDNYHNMLQDLETMDERDAAKIKIAAYQQRFAIEYNMNIIIRRFQVADVGVKKNISEYY